jgi:hypothetical protein
MADLVDGALATGNDSFTPGQASPISHGASEPWDNLHQNKNLDNDYDSDNVIDPVL